MRCDSIFIRYPIPPNSPLDAIWAHRLHEEPQTHYHHPDPRIIPIILGSNPQLLFVWYCGSVVQTYNLRCQLWFDTVSAIQLDSQQIRAAYFEHQFSLDFSFGQFWQPSQGIAPRFF